MRAGVLPAGKLERMSELRLERRARAFSAVPMPPKADRPWWSRVLHSPMFWATIGLAVVYFLTLVDQYWLHVPDRTQPDGQVALGINNEALRKAAFWAMWTALFWGIAFIVLDRWRPQRLLIWLWTFGWGAAVSTWISVYINTWAGQMMSVQGQSADTGARPAIFIAPFVEEASKATVLFLLAILMRYQLVNRMNLISLAGLSAVGFAFTENILYYGRAYVYASHTIEAGDPDDALAKIVLLRGVFTSFGHPLFTSMTAIGLVIGLRARSKIVRVMAPLTGFVLAAFGHMTFNGLATTGASFLQTSYPVIAVLVIYLSLLIMGTFAEGRLIRMRLFDFVRMGWLSERAAFVFSSFWKRTKLIVASVFRGPKVTVATVRYIRGITELAYLRDSRIRGLVDNIGINREKELLELMQDLSESALTETDGLKTFIWPFKSRKFRDWRQLFRFRRAEKNSQLHGYPMPNWGPPVQPAGPYHRPLPPGAADPLVEQGPNQFIPVGAGQVGAGWAPPTLR